MAQTGRKRPLLPVALVALEVIEGFKAGRIRLGDYELQMGQRGYWGRESATAMSGLIRRGWVIMDGSIIVITDDGWKAVTEGIGVETKAPRPRQPGNRRMPSGLF